MTTTVKPRFTLLTVLGELVTLFTPQTTDDPKQYRKHLDASALREVVRISREDQKGQTFLVGHSGWLGERLAFRKQVTAKSFAEEREALRRSLAGHIIQIADSARD